MARRMRQYSGMTPESSLRDVRVALLVRLRAEAALPQQSRETRASSESLARVIELVETLDVQPGQRQPVGIGREVVDSWWLTAAL